MEEKLWLTIWIVVLTQSIILVSDNELVSVEAIGGYVISQRDV